MEPVDPVVQDLQTRCFRRMSAERKLQLADELLQLALELKRSSLRSLYPGAAEPELRSRTAAWLDDVPG